MHTIEMMPPEMWYRIFDYLAHRDLMSISHVNTSLQTLALDHPFYWSDIRQRIKEDSISPGAAIELFGRRVSQGGERIIDRLVLVCGALDDTAQLRRLLLSAIPRVRTLGSASQGTS